MLKHFIADYFTFSKKERRAIIVIIVAIVVIALLPFLFPFFIKKSKGDAEKFKKDIASLELQQVDSNRYNGYNSKETYDDDQYRPYEKKEYKIKGELFYFDPNTISGAEWKRLGVRDKTIGTIQNYLAKGGKFKIPEDLGKIWGFFPNEIERLTPYIQIRQTDQFTASTKTSANKPYERTKYSIVPVDINSGDTTAFIALPGIGSKLAQRIISFREKLGGFYKAEQIGETFGLPDSTYQKIKPYLQIINTTVKQLNINTATADELKVHPYIRWNFANAIVQYRTQHGKFNSLNDIKNIMVIDEAAFLKMIPYLRLN